MKTDAQLYISAVINVIYIKALSTRGVQMTDSKTKKLNVIKCKFQKETTLRLVEAMMPEEAISQ